MEVALYEDGGSLFVWIHNTKAIHIDRKLLSLAPRTQEQQDIQNKI